MGSEKMDKSERAIAEEFKRVSEISEKIDISTSVMKNIREMEDHRKPLKINPFRWSFALTLAGLFLIVLISFTFFFFEREYSGNPVNGEKNIRIKSVEIEGREAKKYYYNSEDKNRVVIWVQKYSEG